MKKNPIKRKSEKVFCRECQKEGKKSRLSMPMVSSQGCFGEGGFWDEDGNAHHHYGGKGIKSFQCSNGHRYQEIVYSGECPCGWKYTGQANP